MLQQSADAELCNYFYHSCIERGSLEKRRLCAHVLIDVFMVLQVATLRCSHWIRCTIIVLCSLTGPHLSNPKQDLLPPPPLPPHDHQPLDRRSLSLMTNTIQGNLSGDTMGPASSKTVTIMRSLHNSLALSWSTDNGNALISYSTVLTPRVGCSSRVILYAVHIGINCLLTLAE